MSDEETPEPTPPPYGDQQPNWGSAYPPPPPGPPPVGQQPYGYQQYAPPKHPQATTAMVLGIVSLAGAFFCLLPIFAAPFAWYIGSKSVKEIDAQPQQYSGRNEANTGKILGIIGTVLLALAIAALVLLIGGLAIAGSTSEFSNFD